jgi:hypothetical protein
MARQDCFASWNNAMDKLDTLTLFVRIVERFVQRRRRGSGFFPAGGDRGH